MNRFKILLGRTEQVIEENYSIEAGRNDDVRHFDHHGEFAGCPAPCNNPKICAVGEEYPTVHVTHMDADTFIGVCKLIGKGIPALLDYSLMEQIDLNGSSVCQNRYNPTLLWMVGLGEMARRFDVPYCPKEGVIDITEKFMLLYNNMDEFEVIGKEATDKCFETIDKCLACKTLNVGMWFIDKNDSFDPSLPYKLYNHDVVIVYRRHHKAISVYVNPKSTCGLKVDGNTFGGVLFTGREKAGGSPRGVEMSIHDAHRVWADVNLFIDNLEV